MTKKVLGEIIATRNLEFVHRDDHRESVQVFIGKPICSDQGPWYCPYLIKADSFEQQFRMAGEDSMQALILTLNIIFTELEALARDQDGTFIYFGQNDLGFPHRNEK